MSHDETAPDRVHAIVVLIIAVHTVVLVWISFINSPNLDELAHLPAGISHWELGRFDLYRVNPPLVRMVAAIPVRWTDAVRDWSSWDDRPYARAEFAVGVVFVQNNGFKTFHYFALARLACIPFSILGCVVAYRWATELYGWRSGLMALLLYTTCPNMTAWGASMTPDAASAATGLWATWTFWNWLRFRTWKRAAVAGFALGIAQLTKSIWIFLPAIYLGFWLAHRMRRSATGGAERPPTAVQFAGIVILGLYLVNLGYGFEGSFTPLGEFNFVSHMLSGVERPPSGANRFSDSIAGHTPIPLPENYVRGIDVQKYDFERGKWSYLRGEQKRGGWWYYYLYALLVKTPLATLALIGLAVLCGLVRRQSLDFDEWLVVVPACFVFVIVSSQVGFNRYFRYVLPAVPFLYIITSRILRRPPGVRNATVSLCGLLLGCAALEGAIVLPHSLSFFNRAAGGPLGGPHHLLDANIDWGQDLLSLRSWYDEHPDARPLHVAYFAGWDIPPSTAGIECAAVPQHNPQDAGIPELAPGWYAVSVNYVYGYRYFDSDQPVYEYFRQLKPVDRAGYSIYIYHVE